MGESEILLEECESKVHNLIQHISTITLIGTCVSLLGHQCKFGYIYHK